MISEGRPLTCEEDALAKLVYNEALKTSVVRIFKNARHPRRGSDTQPHAVDNAIYYPPASPHYYSDNFGGAGATIEQRATFIHELAHVWQNQASIKLSDKAWLTDYGHHNAYDVDPIVDTRREILNPPKGSGYTESVVIDKPVRQSEADQSWINIFRASQNKKVLTVEKIASLRQMNLRYNYMVHDLNCDDFYAFNREEQANIIEDYYLLLIGERPEKHSWSASSQARPPMAAYRRIIPFAK